MAIELFPPRESLFSMPNVSSKLHPPLADVQFIGENMRRAFILVPVANARSLALRATYTYQR